MDWYILDENKCPRLTSLQGFAMWKSVDRDRCILAQDEAVVDGKTIQISTVFLGSGSEQHGRPLLWETMLTGDSIEQLRVQHVSYADAKQAHQDTCEVYFPNYVCKENS